MQKTLLVFVVLLFGVALHGQQPITVSAVAPHYPPIAVVARVSGEVSVVLKVSADGVVTSAETSSGSPLLKKASEDAAKQWKFEPSAGGERQVTIRFKYVLLADAEEPGTEVRFSPPYQVAVETHPAKPYVSYGTPNRTHQQNQTGAAHEADLPQKPPQ